MSIFVWVKPTTVKQLGEVYGFTIQQAKGEGRFYIESHDSLLDPTAEIKRLPLGVTQYVTVRNTSMECTVEPGVYVESPDDIMLVREVPGDRKCAQQGGFPVLRYIPYSDKRNISIKASSLLAAQDILIRAIEGRIRPKPDVDEKVMSALA